MLYHYTFNTYLGINLLEDQEIRSFLMKTFRSIAEKNDFVILKCEILGDHVHMLIEQSYALSTSMVMKLIKGSSARSLFKAYPTNRFDIRKLWARSYHSRKVKCAEKETVINYIKGQRNNEGIDKRF